MTVLKGSSDIRRGPQSIINAAYHVTFTTENRKSIFKDFDAANMFRHCLKNSDDQGYSKTSTFCIMPDHIHWLFVLTEGALSKTVARVKADFSRKSKMKIWQDGFHDHAIRSDESLINVARYIVANPLRANLVKKVGMYPYWDSVWLE
jgi:putative transposase